MAPVCGVGIILKFGAIVKNPAIIGEEHLPGFQAELHSEIGLTQQRFYNFQGFLLVRCQWLPRLLMADLDVVVQIPGGQFLPVPVKYWCVTGRRFALLELSPTIEIKWLMVEGMEYIGMAVQQFVVEGTGADELALSSQFRRVQAE